MIAALAKQAGLSLGPRLGEGGEGVVHELTGRPREVAKLYHTPLSGAAGDKLRAMVAMDPGPLGRQAAWPRELIEAPKGEVAGFIMERASEPFDVHEVYSPRDRMLKLASADWAFLVRVAQNISIAFAAAHARGIVIGDVNHGSVRVAPDARVRLIDCDSMQISTGAITYRCGVGVDTYTPPELQGLRLGDLDRTPDHDGFGLAVLVFHLLFLGRHPFAGVPAKAGAPTDIAGAIAAGAFAYHPRARLLRPPPMAPSLKLVTPEIGALFEAAFQPAKTGAAPQRPGARDWFEGLRALAGTVRSCGRNSVHSFSSAAGQCPWCQYEANGLVFFFKDRRAGSAPTGRLDPRQLEKVMARLAAHKRALDSLANWAPSTAAPKLPARWTARLTWFLVRELAPWVCGALILFGLDHWVLFVAALALIGLALGGLNLHEAALKRRLRRVDAQIRGLGGGLSAHDVTQVQLLHDRALSQERHAQSLRQAAGQWAGQGGATLKGLQLSIHLESFRIRPGLIDGIGPSRVAQLASFGIETAADIDMKTVRQVPGFGYTFASRLVQWRQGHEAGFRFDPKKANDPAILARFRAQRRQHEREYARALGEIEQVVQRLSALESAAHKRKAQVEAKIGPLAREKAQLEADLARLE